MRGTRLAVFAVLLLLGFLPGNSQGQAAATIPLLDPVYHDLARLEAFGLAPRGLTAQRPFSVARVGLVLEDARRWLASRSDLPDAARADMAALLDRLDRRFGAEQRARPSLVVDLEAGGGRSPGHGVPDNGPDIGSVDAVFNPLWAYRNGRTYGDRAFTALSVGLAIPAGARAAFGVAGRTVAGRSSGLRRGRGDAAVEAAYARVVLGAFALQAGRDGLAWGRGGQEGLLLSDNGPPLDLVRLGTDRPLRLIGLGQTELSLFAADLGPDQNFPHAKLFGAKLSVRPVSGFELGFATLNKQGGEGAPEASTTERLKDLSFIWDLFRPGRDYLFSEKLVSLDFRLALPSVRGLTLYGEAALNDFDHRRIGDVLSADGAYLLGISLPRLGAAQRHGLLVEGGRVGPTVYRHHQFRTGLAVARAFQGSELGPSGRGVRAVYGYDAPSARWRGTLSMAVEERSVDPWVFVYHPDKDVVRDGDQPDEIRLRFGLGFHVPMLEDRAGIEGRAAVERLRSFAYLEGDDRVHAAASLRFWWTLS